MDKPSIILDLEKRLNELLSRDDKPDVSIKDLAEWYGISYQAMLNMNLSHELPFGMAYKVGDRGYHSVNKLVVYNFVANGGLRK